MRLDHPLCAQPTTTVSALLQYHLALPSIPTMLEERAWNKLGLSAQEYVNLICDDVTILKRIAQNSDACLFSTEFVLREELASFYQSKRFLRTRNMGELLRASLLQLLRKK